MADVRKNGCWVLMPPEFEVLGGLFLPALPRGRLAGRLAGAVAGWRDQRRRIFFDPGVSGYTAEDLAEEVKRYGGEEAFVVGTVFDRTAAGLLCDALVQAGIRCKRPLLGRKDGEEIMEELSRGVEGRPVAGSPGPQHDKELVQSSPCFVIIGEGDPIPTQVTVFRKDRLGLIRETEGRAGSIPAWVREIRFYGDEAYEVSKSKMDEPVIHAVSLPSSNPDGDIDTGLWLERCRHVIEKVGPGRFRLCGAETLPASKQGTASTIWACRYGLHDPRIRTSLLELVAGYLPGMLILLNTVIGFYEMCVDPLEEMYAGCSLPDRNACLIENIVP